METFDAIYGRRSIKHYHPDHELTDDEINKLMEAAIQSPTSFNIQHWRFVLVRDKETREQLRAAAYNQAQVADASLLIVLTADLEAHGKEPDRYWKNSPPEVAEKLVKMLFGLYDKKPQLQRDEAMRSMGIAAQTIMLAAKDMGYDTGALVGYDPDKVAEIINLPDDHILGMMIVVGKAKQGAWGKPGQLSLEDVIVHDKFPK
ncbi:nitroreductase family protein [Bremerella cremea]|uniref:Nitroreductase family protein n=1 Tax=Blastopirellula marina TaxID=124 RepID=A0A2S8FPM8_9BACT|nr:MULTISPECIES: nitroreductase family protein [Pirellulaceae]PQO34141.1 nitroreductase family protein [Blastopirellula marina]RCS46638.1 nitroreductase family protein [Bremerella cremea]